MRPALIVPLLALAACAEPMQSLPALDAGPAGPSPVAPAADGCGAAGLQVLVGQDVALFESQARSGPARILRPGQPATADFSAARVNVVVDRSNRITRISCG